MGFLQALDSYFRCFRKIKGRTTLKKAVAVITLIAFMIANFNAVYIPQAFAEVSPAAGGNFLIVQDLPPWGLDSNETVLESLGIPFQIVDSSHFATFDLKSNRIKVIIIAADQYQSTYKNLMDDKSKLEDFVNNGGVLIVHATDNAEEYGEWRDLPFVPGGLTHVDERIRDVYIEDWNSPIVQDVDDSELHWYYTVTGILRICLRERKLSFQMMIYLRMLSTITVKVLFWLR